ncbi:MAG: DUF61 family protein [Desulfurococcus sp.]|jgi:uncharacterized protein (UPF0216 family)|uniref:DUF61 family protein n=1 Tax=Desulfurococcus sp. TaxID=51678 RepID=UPI003167A720
MSDNYIERFLNEELRLVNKHAPYERRNLCELLEMEIPYIVLRDGSQHILDPRELRRLHDILAGDACRLQLPIVIEYIPGEREGTYVVRDEIGAKAIALVMNMENPTIPLFLSRTHILVLRRILRTTTTILLNPGSVN